MKCAVCKNDIEETFMNKILGTVIKNSKGKKQVICFECQKKFNNDKTKILEALS